VCSDFSFEKGLTRVTVRLLPIFVGISFPGDKTLAMR